MGHDQSGRVPVKITRTAYPDVYFRKMTGKEKLVRVMGKCTQHTAI
jgi:hypothetical protein